MSPQVCASRSVRRAVERALVAPVLVSIGCVGTPTPLAPGLQGTVGVPHQGVQTNAVELPAKGAHYVRYRPRGKHHWAVPRLVTLIEEAAAHVERELPNGAPLVVGDLSARWGGKIPGHNSHRTGRDVDLLYYATTTAGVPVRTPGFVHFEGDGLAFVPGTGRYLQLDVPRQWALFKFLLDDTRVGIQFLFVSREVEALVIDYALARGEPLELVYRAATVLLQPTDSMPHDDHVHVRIACAPEELVLGCTGGGPYWEWLPSPPVPAALTPEVLSSWASDDPLQDEGAGAAIADNTGGA